jgi:hypothetical protein
LFIIFAFYHYFYFLWFSLLILLTLLLFLLFLYPYVIINKKLGIKLNQNPNNPLHGIKLEMIINSLVENYGWDELGRRVNINCFNYDPSVKSSLKFLRKTPWAREKVEKLYLSMINK